MAGKKGKGSKAKRERMKVRNPRGNKRGGRKYKKTKRYKVELNAIIKLERNDESQRKPRRGGKGDWGRG